MIRVSHVRNAFAVLALALGAAACEKAPTAAPVEESPRLNVVSSTELDIQEAALKHFLANYSMTGVDARCVSTNYPNDVDASPELLARFAAEVPPVVPLSHCTISVTGDTYNPTGGFAQWFFMGPAAISGKGAELEAGFHFNGRLFERHRCTVRQTGSTWAVRSCTLIAAG